MRKNIGVAARDGTHGWDHREGVGRVPAHQGEYHDAIHNKRNEFWLVLMEIFGGLAPGGVKLFNLYSQRARTGTDRTEYVAVDATTRGAHPFAPHWAQLLSAAVIDGELETRRARCALSIRRLKLRGELYVLDVSV